MQKPSFWYIASQQQLFEMCEWESEVLKNALHINLTMNEWTSCIAKMPRKGHYWDDATLFKPPNMCNEVGCPNHHLEDKLCTYTTTLAFPYTSVLIELTSLNSKMLSKQSQNLDYVFANNDKFRIITARSPDRNLCKHIIFWNFKSSLAKKNLRNLKLNDFPKASLWLRHSDETLLSCMPCRLSTFSFLLYQIQFRSHHLDVFSRRPSF